MRPGSELLPHRRRTARSGSRFPPVRPGTVVRVPLLEQLARDEPGPIVSVAAPAGYGKTTLLSQWAERSSHAFAWVSVEESDDDPKVLLRYVAEALDAVEPVDPGVFEALSSSGSSVPGSVVPRLASAFKSMTTPVVRSRELGLLEGLTTTARQERDEDRSA